MTSSGNKFLDQINRSVQAASRAKEARDKKEEFEKKAAVARARGLAKIRSGGSRSSLRSSGKSATGRGRGIVVKANKNGRGFKGIARYALDPNKNGQIVCTNCPTDPIPTMIHSASLRPDIQNPVAHISLSLPPQTGRIDSKRWSKISDSLRSQINLNDSFPYVVVRHRDTDHDHVHLIFSRVSISGKVHDQGNIGLRLQAAERALENQFSLPLVPRKSAGNITKGEIEKALRTEQAPARIVIANALESALQGSPSLEQLVERLELAGITVNVNQSESTGKVAGLSFEIDGVAFKASQIGREYGWKSLSTRLTGFASEEVQTHEQTIQSSPTTPSLGSSSERQNSTDDQSTTPRLAEPATPTSSPAAARTTQTDRSTERKASCSTATPTRSSAEPTPKGFAGTKVLDDGLRGWTDNLPDRLRVAGLQSADRRLIAYLDSRERVIAIQSIDGIAIPDHKLITHEQLESLITALPDGVAIETQGREAFTEKAARAGRSRNLCQPVASPATAPERPEEGAIEWGEADREDQDQAAQPRPA